MSRLRELVAPNRPHFEPKGLTPCVPTGPPKRKVKAASPTPTAPESDLPIIDPDDDDDFDDYDDDEDTEEDEALDLDVDSEPRIVLITGACGNIGRKLRAAWEDVYDLILLDANPGEDDDEVSRPT